jgi:hypothetical protein
MFGKSTVATAQLIDLALASIMHPAGASLLSADFHLHGIKTYDNRTSSPAKSQQQQLLVDDHGQLWVACSIPSHQG